MKKSIIIVLLLSVVQLLSAQEPTQKERLSSHIGYLASDDLNGRKAGSIYAELAASYIEDRLNEIGLEPFFANGPEHRFQKDGIPLNDIVYKIEGNDPALKGQYIIIGAHYDHLGVKQGKIFNGADDNASGTGAIIEVARTLKKNQSKLGRSIIIAAFDGEEEGLFGSYELAEVLADSLGTDNISLMMSLDMVGWYSAEGALQIEGVSTVYEGEELLQEFASQNGITVKTKHFENSILTATDTQGFAEMKIPTLAITTGLKSPYHKPEDDAELIDYEGLDRICNYISNLTLKTSSYRGFKPSGRVAPKHNRSDKLFQLGISGSIGTDYFLFNGSALRTSQRRFSWNGGLIAQFNLKDMTVQTGALYEGNNSAIPVSDDIYGPGVIYNQKAVTVPLTFIMKGGDYVNAFVGFGAYYSRVIEGKFSNPDLNWDVKPNQCGLALKFGMGLGRFSFCADFRRELGTPFYGEGSPRTYLMGTYFTLNYMLF